MEKELNKADARSKRKASTSEPLDGPTTIYTLSKDLSVSPGTISKALRGSIEISAEMRQKIRNLAAEKNFRPRVVSRKVPNICVLIQQYVGHKLDFGLFLSTILEGVAEFVQEEGLEMSVYADNIEKLNSCDIVRELRRRSIDGAVVVRGNDQSEYFTQLEKEKFPYCALLSSSVRHREHVILVNNEEIGHSATRHLIDKGHKQIGVLVSPPSGNSGQERLAGYKRALTEAGLAVEDRLILHEPSDKNGLQFGTAGIRELLQLNPEMTGVFAMDHSVLVGLLHGVRAMGLTVPGHLSVISCDDYPETAYLHPPASVVDIPNRELAYLAAWNVYRLIRGLPAEIESNKRKLEAKVIERESTGPPRLIS